jgi:hypothetical protein
MPCFFATWAIVTPGVVLLWRHGHSGFLGVDESRNSVEAIQHLQPVPDCKEERPNWLAPDQIMDAMLSHNST